MTGPIREVCNATSSSSQALKDDICHILTLKLSTDSSPFLHRLIKFHGGFYPRFIFHTGSRESTGPRSVFDLNRPVAPVKPATYHHPTVLDEVAISARVEHKYVFACFLVLVEGTIIWSLDAVVATADPVYFGGRDAILDQTILQKLTAQHCNNKGIKAVDQTILHFDNSVLLNQRFLSHGQ